MIETIHIGTAAAKIFRKIDDIRPCGQVTSDVDYCFQEAHLMRKTTRSTREGDNSSHVLRTKLEV